MLYGHHMARSVDASDLDTKVSSIDVRKRTKSESLSGSAVMPGMSFMSMLCWDNKASWEGIIEMVLALEMKFRENLDGAGRFGMVEGRSEAEAVSNVQLNYYQGLFSFSLEVFLMFFQDYWSLLFPLFEKKLMLNSIIWLFWEPTYGDCLNLICSASTSGFISLLEVVTGMDFAASEFSVRRTWHMVLISRKNNNDGSHEISGDSLKDLYKPFITEYHIMSRSARSS
ncbi:hypothetical protein ACQ4PT_000878 [Festuca glaucescens]